MRSRVMPGSSPTMERRLPVRRLKSVDLPTLGRPTIAIRGKAAAPGLVGITDLRKVGKNCSWLLARSSAASIVAGSGPDAADAICVEDDVFAQQTPAKFECLSRDEPVKR